MNPTTFQHNRPVFVRAQQPPFRYGNGTYNWGENVPWEEIGIPVATVDLLFKADLLFHSEELEKEAKVGDRLSELDWGKMETLVNLLNAEVKAKTNSKQEYMDKRCKKSRVEHKQRSLIRQFLNRSPWITETFYEKRDRLITK